MSVERAVDRRVKFYAAAIGSDPRHPRRRAETDRLLSPSMARHGRNAKRQQTLVRRGLGTRVDEQHDAVESEHTRIAECRDHDR